jgi:DNA-binding MarR family transcriptional regulator
MTKDSEKLARLRARSVGFHLISAAYLWNTRAIERVNEDAGRPVLRDAHTRLFPHIGFEAVRIVDLAAKVGVSKQAVSPLVADMAREGVVEILPDPDDARAKRVRLTKAGVRAFLHGTQVLVDIERDLEARVGKATMARMRRDLAKLHHALAESGASNPSPIGRGA